MRVKLKIRFVTAEPISQSDGMKMWQLGDHFVAVGARQYQLTTEGVSDSVLSAAEGLLGNIRTALDDRQVFVTHVETSTDELPETATVFAARAHE